MKVVMSTRAAGVVVGAGAAVALEGGSEVEEVEVRGAKAEVHFILFISRILSLSDVIYEVVVIATAEDIKVALRRQQSQVFESFD